MNDSDRPRLAFLADDASYSFFKRASKKFCEAVEGLRSLGIETPSAATEHFLKEMEQKGSRVIDLVLTHSPRQLLGYLWGTHFMATLGERREQGEKYRPNKLMNDSLQFVLEYVHAAWSCCETLPDDGAELDEGRVAELLEVSEDLRDTTMLYCLMKARALTETTGRSDLGGHCRTGDVSVGESAWSALPRAGGGVSRVRIETSRRRAPKGLRNRFRRNRARFPGDIQRNEGGTI